MEMRKPTQELEDIVFAHKVFAQGGEELGYGFVTVSGTLTGKGLAYPNNTYAVSCLKQYNACFVSNVEQIGRNQIGRMENPFAYPIVKWTSDEIIAEGAWSLCFKVTITIDRKAESLLWVEEPINQTKPNCKDANTTIRKYSIEDSPRWKKMSGNK